MKQNIILIGILVILFFFGLFIYDFSDELDGRLVNNDWYTVKVGAVAVMRFTENAFLFFDEETKEQLPEYRSCTTFRFNRNINVIRLNCPIRANKIHIYHINENYIKLMIDGGNYKFFKNREDAIIYDFMKENELDQITLDELMNFNFNTFNIIEVSDFANILRDQSANEYVAIVSRNNSLQNALNIAALKIINNNRENLSIIIASDLSETELTILSSLYSDIDLLNDEKILIFKIQARKIDIYKEINVRSFNEIKNFNEKGLEEY